MSQRFPVASVEDVPAGTGAEIVAGGRIIALFNVNGTFHAVDGVCAHAGGPVGKGELNGCIVTCPWHGWQYDVSTGRHCLTDNIAQQSFPAEVEDGMVYVELPDS